MDTTAAIGLDRQLAILIEALVGPDGRAYSLPRLAASTGIRHQTLHNLLRGKAHNPRLDTLQSLCRFYGISLDYFASQTEAECRAYLAQKRIESAPPIVHEIAAQSNRLSRKGQRNVLAIMQWIELGGKV
jgi:transcriptional regulator with XRE-family HTH domain